MNIALFISLLIICGFFIYMGFLWHRSNTTPPICNLVTAIVIVLAFGAVFGTGLGKILSSSQLFKPTDTILAEYSVDYISDKDEKDYITVYFEVNDKINSLKLSKHKAYGYDDFANAKIRKLQTKCGFLTSSQYAWYK